MKAAAGAVTQPINALMAFYDVLLKFSSISHDLPIRSDKKTKDILFDIASVRSPLHRVSLKSPGLCLELADVSNHI